MPTRNVSLTPELDLAVEKRVQSGRYENASEVIRAALRALAHQERMEHERIRVLRKAIQEGLASGIADDFSIDSVLKEAGLSSGRRRKRA